MSGYDVYTLFGEAPDGSVGEVKVAVQANFLEEKKWRLVVERVNKQGQAVQKDVTQGLKLMEAVQRREDISTVYASDGWRPQATGVNFRDPSSGDIVYLYVDVDP